MARVLITGGAGFIGNHLANRLILDGHSVIVYDNLSRGNSLFATKQQDHIEFVLGDLRDYTRLYNTVAKSEVIYHLGAQANVVGAINDPDYCVTTNVMGTYNLLKASKEIGVKRIVFTSSREVYGEVKQFPVNENTPLKWKNPYGYSKAIGEQYCYLFNNFYKLPVVILRLANVFGPGDTGRVIPLFIEKACSGVPLVVYGGEQIIDFIWIDQVVEALISAMVCPVTGIPINIGSGEGISILDVANLVIGLVHSSSKIVIEPERNFETQKYIADISRMKKYLSLKPINEFSNRLNQMIHEIS